MFLANANDDPTILILVVIVGLVVLALWVATSLMVNGVPGRREDGPMYCPVCRTVAKPRCRLQGSNGISIVLLVVFLPAFIVYEIWRRSVPMHVCPTCGRGGMLPTHAPAVNQSRAESARPVIPAEGPGRFRICGVDRTSRFDTVWHCSADSEANARAKGELEGILVTRVERVA